MKKICLLIAVAAIALYSCKKDGTTTTVTNTVHDTTITTSYATGLVNADTLTAGLKVGYGTNVTGTFPAASTDADAPLLDSLYNKFYTVVKSRYLVIYPPTVAGNFTGYYVQIAGANSYFKVDYTTAVGLRKGKTTGANFRSDAEGNIDSTILIKLPADIKGDTFYVKYAAYDDQNRVSNAITARVIVLPEGDDKFTDSLIGNWRVLGQRAYYNGAFTTDTFTVDTASYNSYAYYTCDNGQLVASGDETDINLPQYKYSYSSILTFGKYTYDGSYSSTGYSLDLTNSTCSNYVYTQIGSESWNNGTGAFSFDSKSRNLTLILDSGSNVDLNYGTYKLEELTSTYMILSMSINYSDDNAGIGYFKIVKQ